MFNRPKVGDILTLDTPDKQKFLLLSTPYEDDNNANTLASMVILHQIKVYWFGKINNNKVEYASQVDNPQTIYGASPAYFGVRINN